MEFKPFTDKDFELIDEAYASLREAARERCRAKDEFELVQKAFRFACEAHMNVRRRSSEPYILHPIAVAKIVVEEIGLGCKSIAASLLHDVVEDTEYSVSDIRDLFGDKIAQLVDGLTKIKTVLDNENMSGNSVFESKSLQAENFKRILLTLGDDARVVLIKLADRLHNCRTIEFMPEHKRDKILSETMYIFIPLAHRLGLYSIKSEMENIWLKFKEPQAYGEINSMINRSVELRSDEMEKFVAPIESALKDRGIDFRIKKRVKTTYSVWRKMTLKQIPIEQVYDLYAVRIIFDPHTDDPLSEKIECYNIYALLTSLYNDRPDRLRDWLKQPKSNGYEALHCTLMSPEGTWVEVQIRSRRMDDIAEKGIAAHWAYKQEGYVSENDSQVDKWLEKVKDIIESPDLGALELLDVIHKDLVSSQITVFTPKGVQKSVQAGTTALDFAYMIHSDIGNHSIAAKINMKLQPLNCVLKSGDQVEIITADSAKPQVEWISFLQTRHARRSVLDWIRENAPSKLQEAQTLMSCGAAGSEPMRDRTILNKGVKYILCSCCNPIPGDPVIGFRDPDGSVQVHKKSCRVAEGLASKYGDVMVVPSWESEEGYEFPVTINVKAFDHIGLLNEITQVISRVMGLNMRHLLIDCDNGLFDGTIELLVRNRSNLETMIESMKKVDGIQSVVRNDIQ